MKLRVQRCVYLIPVWNSLRMPRDLFYPAMTPSHFHTVFHVVPVACFKNASRFYGLSLLQSSWSWVAFHQGLPICSGRQTRADWEKSNHSVKRPAVNPWGQTPGNRVVWKGLGSKTSRCGLDFWNSILCSSSGNARLLVVLQLKQSKALLGRKYPSIQYVDCWSLMLWSCLLAGFVCAGVYQYGGQLLLEMSLMKTMNCFWNCVASNDLDFQSMRWSSSCEC